MSLCKKCTQIFRKFGKKFGIIAIFIAIVSGSGSYYSFLRPLPEGIDYQGKIHTIAVQSIHFLHDLTFQDSTGALIAEQEIFDTLFARIDTAQHYILLDMFLFNPYITATFENFRDLSGELTAKLIQKTRTTPGIKIDFITDPINTVYGGTQAHNLQQLREAGINVIMSDLTDLRDSNLLYSPLWRTFFQWFGNSDDGGLLPHPFAQDQNVTLRSYLIMFNFKANHRKIFIADYHDTMTTIITSANPHNGSSAHSNVALEIHGTLWQDVYQAESFVAAFSEGDLQEVSFESSEPVVSDEQDTLAHVQLLTEERIETELLAALNDTGKGDAITVGMFYLSDRSIIDALKQAATRGVDIRIILDPSKDAFGYEKNGVPNRPAAHELLDDAGENIQIRWYDTHGEQFHSKFTLIDKQNGTSLIFLGSANLTRRNLNNYNLEANVKVVAPRSSDLVQEMHSYYEQIWKNMDGNQYTAEYAKYAESSFYKTMLYRLFETFGLSTF